MWGLLGNLVRSFLLLRDLFGYLIPGLVFVASAVYYIFPDHFANKSPLAIAKLASDAVTNWPILITLIIGAYVAGHCLVAIGYTLYDIARFVRGRMKPLSDDEQKKKKEEAAAVRKDLLFYRYGYPDLFIERDRRATINILRIGLAVVLVIDGFVWPFPYGWITLGVGLLMVWNGWTGSKHVGDETVDALAAGKDLTAASKPFLARS